MVNSSISMSEVVRYIAGKVFDVPGKIEHFSVSVQPWGSLFIHVGRRDLHASVAIPSFHITKRDFDFIDSEVKELINGLDRLEKSEV